MNLRAETFLLLLPWLSLGSGPLDLKRDFGAVGDSSTDDTSALQSALDAFRHKSGGLFCPAGSYKITRTLVYEGDVSHGLNFEGEVGATRGASGCRIMWYGPRGGTVFYVLGANTSTFKNIDFDGRGIAKAVLWVNATNTYPGGQNYVISSVSRKSGIVAVTTRTAHSVIPGDTVKITGVSDPSFNGTFTALYADSPTTFALLQGGPDASSAGGTAERYKSHPSSGIVFDHVGVSDFASVSAHIVRIIRSGNVLTVSTATPHYLIPGDRITISGVTDASYDGEYIVSDVDNSTAARMEASKPAAPPSTGGTLTSDSSGFLFGQRQAATPQVSEIDFLEVLAYGNRMNSQTCIRWNEAGNVKNYKFLNGAVSGCRYGFFAPGGIGTLLVHGTTMAGITSADFFVGPSNVSINGVEVEDKGSRFVVGTTGSNAGSVSITNSSWQSAAAPDDVIISYSGNLTLIGNTFYNYRTPSSFPKIVGNVLIAGGQPGGIFSQGNWYRNATWGRFLPVQDSNGNVVFGARGYLGNKAVSITSLGDYGGSSGAIAALSNVASFAAVLAQQSSARAGIADRGFLRLGSFDEINFRNSANTANILGMSKNPSDQISIGGAPGVLVTGPLRLSCMTLDKLGRPGDGTLACCSDCKSTNPCSAGGTGAFAKRLHSTWICN